MRKRAGYFAVDDIHFILANRFAAGAILSITSIGSVAFHAIWAWYMISALRFSFADAMLYDIKADGTSRLWRRLTVLPAIILNRISRLSIGMAVSTREIKRHRVARELQINKRSMTTPEIIHGAGQCRHRAGRRPRRVNAKSTPRASLMHDEIASCQRNLKHRARIN